MVDISRIGYIGTYIETSFCDYQNKKEILVGLLPSTGGEADRQKKKGQNGQEVHNNALCFSPSFMLSTLAFTCVAFVTGALAWWGPEFIFLGLSMQPDVHMKIET